MAKYRVMLETDVWLTDGEGDPPRTLRKENAAIFTTKEDARKAFLRACRFRSFASGCIIEGD